VDKETDLAINRLNLIARLTFRVAILEWKGYHIWQQIAHQKNSLGDRPRFLSAAESFVTATFNLYSSNADSLKTFKFIQCSILKITKFASKMIIKRVLIVKTAATNFNTGPPNAYFYAAPSTLYHTFILQNEYFRIVHIRNVIVF